MKNIVLSKEYSSWKSSLAESFIIVISSKKYFTDY